jgi:F0F1-type ATP synthase membrane subunit b/b'
MAQPLSQQLADLSVRAKNAEDAIAAASKETHEKIDARKEEARAAAAKATEKAKQEIESARDTVAKNWTAVRAKIAADIDSLKGALPRRSMRQMRDMLRAAPTGWSGKRGLPSILL